MSGQKEGAKVGLPGRKVRGGMVLSSAMIALSLVSNPVSARETCTTPFGTTGLANQLQFIGASQASVAANILAAITTTSTAFLLQSTAFVSGPSNASPDQQGSGVWVRGVGGRADVANTSNVNISVAPAAGGAAIVSGTVGCNTVVDQTFAGFQVGHDVARLNLGGWNVHIGTTAGYLESRGKTDGGNFLGGTFDSTVQAPFAGAYVAVSRGGFFADALLRAESYQADLNSPSTLIFNQKLNGRGWSFAASAGYQHMFQNRMFVEPSAGLVVSRTKIDTLSTMEPITAQITGVPSGIQGNIRFSDVESLIGRAGIRAGTTIQSDRFVWQPFVSASVWHDFADGPKASYTNCGNCAFIGATPVTITGDYTGSTIGTYGQYSVGVSGVLVNTGWVGFARFDYRNGDRIDGYSGTAGIRYHYTPEAVIPAMIGKAPVKAAPVVAAHNWTGFYIGGFAGAAFGWNDQTYNTVDPAVGNVTAGLRTAGAIGGGTIGYNRQINDKFVLGVEFDAGWTNLEAGRLCTGNLGASGTLLARDLPLWNVNCHTDTDWMALLTARVGYVSGRALWYLKGGGAVAEFNYFQTCNVGNFSIFTPIGQGCENANGGFRSGTASFTTASETRWGWTIGYGVEYALTSRWSAKAETNYVDFGTTAVTANDNVTFNSDVRMLVTKVGVNLKLGGGPQ